jgi:uncharacterized protein (TIGR02270 family)
LAILPHIVERHADEAASLWDVRNQAVSAPHFFLRDLLHLDRRIEANLEGLVLAGDDGWTICREALGLKSPGDVFATAVVALVSGKEDRVLEVLEAGTRSPVATAGLISALSWLPYPAVERHVSALLASAQPPLRRVGLAAAAAHRQDPGQPLKAALEDDDPALRARALRAVGELGLVDLRPLARRHLRAADLASRFWAAWTSALLGPDPDALEVLAAEAESRGPRSDRAVQLAVRRMERDRASDWILRLGASSAHLRLAILGAGARGAPELVPWLIRQMQLPPHARVAGEAVTSVTALDLSSGPFRGDRPGGFQAGPTEDPGQEDVAPDPDENLPWPDPAAVERWWGGQRNHFDEGTRYLLGKPVSQEWLSRVLRAGRQRQRSAAALERCLAEAGQTLFEVRAPGFRQAQQLAD